MPTNIVIANQRILVLEEKSYYLKNPKILAVLSGGIDYI